jgi:hypothetical protein
MRLGIPSSLPWLLALFSAACFCAYNLSGLIVHMQIGRPSSTAGIAFLFVPAIGAVVGGVCAVIGVVMMHLLLRAGVNVRLSRAASWGLLTGGAAVVLALAAAGRSAATEDEMARPQPAVMKTSDRVRKLEVPAPVSDEPAKSPLNFEGDWGKTTGGQIEWNGALVDVSHEGGEVTVRRSDGRLIATTDLREFEFVTRVHSAVFCGASEGERRLAVLIKLRATSGRSMLYIFGSSGETVYQEYMDRNYYPDELRVANDREGRQVLLAGRDRVMAWSCQQ